MKQLQQIISHTLCLLQVCVPDEVASIETPSIAISVEDHDAGPSCQELTSVVGNCVISFISTHIKIHTYCICTHNSTQYGLIIVGTNQTDINNNNEVDNSICYSCMEEFPPTKGKGKGRRKKNIDWVGCDACGRWFHCQCIGVSLKDLGDTFLCEQCMSLLKK